MTKNDFKVILFASLIIAMILPSFNIGMVEAVPNENANENATTKIKKTDFQDAVKDVHQKRSEVYLINLENKMSKLSGSDKIKNERAIEALEKQVSKKMEILDSYEKQRIDFYKMDPEREQYILSVVKELRSEVKKFGKSVDMMSYGVNISYVTKGITVGISDASHRDTVQEIIDKYPKDINIVLSIGTAVDESCSSRTSDCDPIVGGISINNDCTLGLPVKRGSVYGFITAGHCAIDDENVYQPFSFFGYNKIGDDTISHYESTCDCAFVKKTTSTNSESTVLRNGNIFLPIISEGTARPTVGTQVVLFGLQSGFQQGEVVSVNSEYTYNGVDWDLVETNLTTTGGDSGAPVTNAAGSEILGIHKGKNIDTLNPVFSSWNVVNDKFGGLSLHS